jgi:signal transduction histidine kinase
MISAFSSTHTLAKEYQLFYAYLIKVLYPITLCSSAALISYPLWLPRWRAAKLEGVVWNIIMFSVLICFSFLMVLISDFSEIQLMIFMVNLIILSSLVTWRWALFNIILGVSSTSFLYYQYIHVTASTHVLSSEFKIVYLLLMVVSTLIIFLKPKQEQQELTEEKNEHLTDRLTFQEQELRESNGLRAEFLRNISHEYHAPMTGVLSTAEVLYDSYDKIPEKLRKESIENIFKSAARLDCFDNNIRILAALSQGKLDLKKEEFDLSSLIYERVERCQKLYDEHIENHELVLNIEKNINLSGDKENLIRAIDNLIINAIQYCPNGKIQIELKNKGSTILFQITDEGIGIPKDELHNIFDEFKVSSKTHTTAGGRGVGLTVAQKIINLHNGKIWAESDGEKGAVFSFTIPIN